MVNDLIVFHWTWVSITALIGCGVGIVLLIIFFVREMFWRIDNGWYDE